MARCGNSRLFFYKVYKIMCKMLKVECILYGRMAKKDKTDIIFGVDSSGLKFPILGIRIESSKPRKNGKDLPQWTSLTIDKRCNMADIQKAIVERVMKAVEVGDVWRNYTSFVTQPTIEKGTCWEQHVIDMDLKNEH